MARTASAGDVYGPYIDVRSFGAVGDGLTDDTEAIQACINAAAESVTLDTRAPVYTWNPTMSGSVVYLNRGVYKISNTLELKNGVTLCGTSLTTSTIAADTGMTDTKMINCVDSTNPIFDSRIERLKLHASNNANIDEVVHAQEWQERCGMYFCEVTGYQGVGLLISDVSSGAAQLSVEHTGFSGYSNVTASIQVDSTVPNAFQMNFNMVSINTSGVATNGILMEKGRGTFTNVHVESATNGIYLEDGTHYFQNITGTGSVVNLITLDGSFPGRARAFMLDPNGATGNTWNDLGIGTDYTGFKAFVEVGAD